MRVVHVIPSMDVSNGGPPVAVTGWARGLMAAGDSVVVVTTDLPGPAKTSGGQAGKQAPVLPAGADGVDVRTVPVSAPRSLAYSRALSSALDAATADADIVHAHMLYLYPTYAAARAAKRRDLPLVISPHGALEPWIRQRRRIRKALTERLWQRGAIDGADALAVTSAQEGRAVAELGYRAPVDVAPIGLDLAAFTSGAAAEGRGEPASGHLIVDHGRLAEKKSLDLLISALPVLVARFPDVRLRLIGPDPDGIGAELMRHARATGVSDRVELAGPLYGASLVEALHAATVWALPSATENFGIAFVEAMACGLPTVVSADVHLASEALAQGACRIAARDPAAIAEAVAALFDDASARATMGAAARRYALSFDIESAGLKLHDLYERAITHHAAARRRGS